MKNSTIRFIILVATLLLGGLIVSQIIWVTRAYRLQETQVNYDITQSLKKVGEDILLHYGDSSFMLDPVTQINEQTFLVKTNLSPDADYVEAALTREFKTREINLDFEYNLYDCFNDSVIYTKVVYINEGETTLKENPSVEVSWKSNDGHYFSVFFPNKGEIVLGRLNFWIFSSLLLVVVVFFFAYTIQIILKQKRLGEIKTDFINNMTHELKTPISTIGLSADVLQQEDIANHPERLKNYADIIKRENQRLQLQVEKVLQIASLEKNQLDLDLKTISIHEMIKTTLKTFEIPLQEREGKIMLKLEAKNDEVEADMTHMQNVITNLVDNAIKYCQKQPAVEISSYNRGGFLFIDIKDNGIGMKSDQMKQVFDKFYRVPTGNVHNVKGFGLGLHYVQQMIEAFHGSVVVRSQEGQGSTFSLKLPIVHA